MNTRILQNCWNQPKRFVNHFAANLGLQHKEKQMIDWMRVNTLREEVGPEDFDEIIALFLEEVDASVARLQTTTSLETLGADLHFIKGSAAGLGFNAFVDQCQVGESLCDEGKADQVDLPSILQAYATSKRLFLEEMPNELAS